MKATHLTKDGLITLIPRLKSLQPRQVLSEEFVMQLVDNYFPSKELPGWLGFYVSDGFAKIRCFISARSEILCTLQKSRERPLATYPVIRLQEIIDITQSQKGSTDPFIMIREYEVLHPEIERIIGLPIPYRVYEDNGFRNPKGSTEIFPCEDPFDFDELELNLKAFEDSKRNSKAVLNTTTPNPINFHTYKPPEPKPSLNPTKIQLKPVVKNYEQPPVQLQKQVQQDQNRLIKVQQPQPEFNAPTQNSGISTFSSKNFNQNPNVPQIPLVQQYAKPGPSGRQGQEYQTGTAQGNKKQQFQMVIQKQAGQQHQQPTEHYPIAMLNNMTQHPFRGRIVRMDDVRHYGGQNGKKEGKLLNIQILDENDLIMGTFFDGAVDKWFNRLQAGRIYSFSGAQIKMARSVEVNKSLGAINFDAIFDVNSRIEELEETDEIKQNKFNFVPIDQIPLKNRDEMVDTIGIIKSVGPIQEFTPKFKTEVQVRRTLIIYDQSRSEIEVQSNFHTYLQISLFGTIAQKINFNLDEIYQFRCFKINEYNSKRSLTSGFSSSIHDDLTLPETLKLAQWRMDAGEDIALQKVGEVDTIKGLRTIDQVIQESKKCETDRNLKLYSNVRAHLMFIKGQGTIYYQSCTNCLRKAIPDGYGGFTCKQCSISMTEPKYRYIVTVKLVDSTATIWATASDVVAQQLINATPENLKLMTDQGREKEKMDTLNENTYREYRFKLASKMEEYNEIQRVKHQIVSVNQECLIDDTLTYLNQIQFYLNNVC